MNLADVGIVNTYYELNPSGNEWAFGDFTGAGVVNLTDVGIINTYYGDGAGSNTTIGANAIDPNPL